MGAYNNALPRSLLVTQEVFLSFFLDFPDTQRNYSICFYRMLLHDLEMFC